MTTDGFQNEHHLVNNDQSNPFGFGGGDLGNFTCTNSLALNGGNNSVWKCYADNDIINGYLNYRVYLTTDSPLAFSSINLNGSVTDDHNTACEGNGTNQVWETNNANVDILSGLSPGTYYLEVYNTADYTWSFGNDGTWFWSNNSNNYRATFTVISDDTDNDGVCDNVDNCPTSNPDQADSDGDDIGDACDTCPNDADNDSDGDDVCGDVDNCPETANADQTDSDGDGLGDVCDDCPNDPNNDADGDGVCDDVDNCSTSNPDQADSDGDGLGDACDACPNDPNNDADGDGVCDDVDNCSTSNPDQADSDGDGLGDACDACPNDPNNDADGDGVCGDVDNCPATANADQTDTDNDGVGDVCDVCPNDPNDEIGVPTITFTDVPLDPINISDAVMFSATADATSLLSATWDWGDGDSTVQANPVLGNLAANHTYSDPGVYEVTLTVINLCGQEHTLTYQYVVIYDPSGGFVTGGGWIDSPEGAYVTDASLIGKANFGFVSKYKKGQSVPDGNTEFQFQAGDLNFKSTSYDWLIIAGTKAIFKGDGKINGVLGYKFLLSAKDESKNGGDDTFRIKIWDAISEVVVYDNQPGAGDDAEAITVIGGGSIIVHKPKGNNNARGVVDDEPLVEKLTLGTEIVSWPNPSKNVFNLKLYTDSNVKVGIYVYDMSGRLVHQSLGFSDKTYQFGSSFDSGIYIVNVTVGDKKQSLKLVKY